MKITNQELMNALPATERLASQPLNVSAALKIRRLRAALREEMEVVEDIREDLIDRYAEKDDDGNPVSGEQEGSVKIDEEKQDEFNDKWEELMEEEATIDYDPLKVEDLESEEDIKVSGRDLDVLMDAGLIVE